MTLGALLLERCLSPIGAGAALSEISREAVLEKSSHVVVFA